jgi:MscS family membrane protein
VARTINIGLAYDTAAHRVAEAVEILRGVLNEPRILEPINMPDRPPRVYFKDFSASSLDLQVIYSYAIKAPGRDWWTYMEHAQEMNLRIFEALNQAGIQMAFPTQTLYLAGDPSRQLSVQFTEQNGHNGSDAPLSHHETAVKS